MRGKYLEKIFFYFSTTRIKVFNALWDNDMLWEEIPSKKAFLITITILNFKNL